MELIGLKRIESIVRKEIEVLGQEIVTFATTMCQKEIVIEQKILRRIVVVS